MSSRGGLIILGAVAVFSSIAVQSTGTAAQTGGAAAAPREASEQTAAKLQDTSPAGLKAVSKALADEAKQLQANNAEWVKKLDEFQVDMRQNPQDLRGAGKEISDCLVVLGKAADLLAPDSETRKAFRRQEAIIRELASNAAVHSNPVVRKTSVYFERKRDEQHALAQAAEEIRTRLITSIELLGTQNNQIEFNRALSQVAETIKDAEATVDDINSIAAGAQKLSDDLDGFGKTAVDATTSGAVLESTNASGEERKGREHRSTTHRHPTKDNKGQLPSATGGATVTTALGNLVPR